MLEFRSDASFQTASPAAYSPIPASPPSSTSAEFDLKAPRQPMLAAALAYAIGILAGVYAPRPAAWLVAAAIALLAGGVFFLRRQPSLSSGLGLGAILIAGALHIQLRGLTTIPDSGLAPFSYGPQVEITGHVSREGKWLQQPHGESRQSVDLETEEVLAGGQPTKVKSGIRLSLYNARSRDGATMQAHPPSSTILRYGERVRIPVKLKLPRNFHNPGAFDYRSYLASNGISALASGKMQDVERLPGFVGSRAECLRIEIRSSILAKVRALWPPPQAALIDAMVVGEPAFIERDTRIDFQRSGTYHILVVSGMNVTILAFVIFCSLRRLRLADVSATLLTIFSCVAYALLTEVGAPVWRATLMCSIFLCTKLLYRERGMVNALGTAALALLIFEPRQLFTASFQMTFLCVLLVAAIGLPLLERSSGLYRRALEHWEAKDYGASLPREAAQLRADLKLIASRLEKFVGRTCASWAVRAGAVVAMHAYELILISAVMQMGLALPMAYYFHRATTIGLPANVAVVPLTQLLMPAVILTILLGYIAPLAAKLPAMITAVALQAITGTVHGLGRLSLADLRVATPSFGMIALTGGALVSAMVFARKHPWFAASGIVALLCASLAFVLVTPKPGIRKGVLEVTAIDVGEGDSIFVVTPLGRTILIDAGGPTWGASSQLDFGEDVVAPYLWQRRITRLDVVAISHGHSDHIGGMGAILRDFRPKELWVGLLPPSEALNDLIAEAHALGVEVVRHWEGDQMNFGGATIDVLFPPKTWPLGREPKNNDSMILQISFGKTSVLLEGDAEKAVERRIAEMHHPEATLLKVGHHGSATSTTPQLLASVKPLFALISVGYHTSYGLPKEEVLERLQAANAKVYRTDLNGAVSFFLDGQTVTPYLPGLQ